MKVLILAAGYATRLYPITKDTPKPLIEVAGRPIIQHILEKVRHLPITEAYIVTNEKFFSTFKEWKKQVHKDYNFELTVINDGTTSNEDRLGAVGDIHHVIKHTNHDDNLLVIAGDNLFEFSLLDVYTLFREKKSSVVVCHDLKDPQLLAKKLGTVTIDENDKVLNFQEKPEKPMTSLAATACYYFTREDLKNMRQKFRDRNERFDNLGDFIKHLVETSQVYAHSSTEKWFDIGSHEQLEQAREYFKEQK